MRLLLLFHLFHILVQVSGCGVGWFLTELFSKGVFTCVPCLSGTVQPLAKVDKDTKCHLCDYGLYQDEANQGVCKKCPPGMHQPSQGRVTCSDCLIGQYTSQEQSRDCKHCAAGKYNMESGQSAETACKDCKAGKYNMKTGQFAETACKPCAIGQFAGVGFPFCLNCAAGQYNDQPGQSACKTCGTGKYNDEKTGKSECKICAAGKYNEQTGQTAETDCKSCAAGKYQEEKTGQSACKTCAPGQFAGVGFPFCLNCYDKTYQNEAAQSSCKLCPAGKNSVTGDRKNCNGCDQGWTIKDDVCTKCAEGTYKNTIGPEECKGCASKHYADQTGLTACKPCGNNKYDLCRYAGPFCVRSACTSAWSIPREYTALLIQWQRIMETSSYSLGTPVQLEQATAQDWTLPPYVFKLVDVTNFALSLADALLVCNAYVPDWTEIGVSVDNTKPTVTCGAGIVTIETNGPKNDGAYLIYNKVSVDPAPTWASSAFPLCAACAPGEFKDTTSGGCAECGTGKFTVTMADAAKSDCKKCPRGWKQPSKGQTLCIQCLPGYYGDEDAKSVCKQCPAGYSQILIAEYECKKCDQGRHQSIVGQPSCSICLVGTYVDEVGSNATACKNCVAGKFQGKQEGNECDECPVGWSTSSTSAPECGACPGGEYQDQTAQIECKSCEPGTFTRGEGTNGFANCTGCPVGYFQPLTKQDTCVPCENGHGCTPTAHPICNPGEWMEQPTHDSRKIHSQCKQCPSGYYSDSTATSECSQCHLPQISELAGNGSKQCLDCGGVKWHQSFTDFNGEGTGLFMSAIKNANHHECLTSKPKTDVLCFAEWNADFFDKDKLCFSETGKWVTYVLAIYVKDQTFQEFNLKDYLTTLKEDKIAWLDQTWWYGGFDGAKDTPFHFESSYVFEPRVKYPKETWDWGREGRVFAQRAATYYDSTNSWDADGAGLCSIEYAANTRVKIIMLYWGHTTMKAGVNLADGNYRINLEGELKGDERCIAYYNEL